MLLHVKKIRYQSGTERLDRRVLFISYPFPPVGGAGVQRATKFVKYLPQFGWMPSVLTVANPSVPAWDNSLLQDVPAEVVVHRARTLEPGYSAKAAVTTNGNGNGRLGVRGMVSSAVHRAAKLVLQPDPQVLWMPGALREGRRILEEARHDAIVVSAPPFSTFILGAALARQSGLPLVLDYRDEWDISNAYWENKRLDWLSAALQRGMQRRVVRSASALVATTRHSAAALDRVRRRSGGDAKVTWIYNGFDAADLAFAPRPAAPRSTYRLTYVGTLWKLTTVEPLVSAVELLSRRNPADAAKLELVFAGRRTPEQSQILSWLKALPCKLIEHPYLDHVGAMELVEGSDGLCVLLSDLPGADRVVPAKIFEYMAARRMILGIGPRGEMWDLLSHCPAARLHTPGDIEGIVSTIQSELGRVSDGRGIDLGGFDPSPFERRTQAGQLARLLDSLVEKR